MKIVHDTIYSFPVYLTISFLFCSPFVLSLVDCTLDMLERLE